MVGGGANRSAGESRRREDAIHSADTPSVWPPMTPPRALQGIVTGASVWNGGGRARLSACATAAPDGG